MSKQTLNRKDIARLISRETGFRISDIEKILSWEGRVITSAISQGYSIKNHKLLKLEVNKKASKEKAWDGLNKRYFVQPEKFVIKYVQLSALDEAIEEYNQSQNLTKGESE